MAPGLQATATETWRGWRRCDWVLPQVGFRAGVTRSGEGRVVVLPKLPAPMLSSGQGHREDRQMHRELQGTRVPRSSRATPHRQIDRQTMILIHIFTLKYMMSEWGRGSERKGQRNTGKESRDKPDKCGSESEHVRERRETEREEQPARGGLNTQHSWSLPNKAPESVTFLLSLWH